MGNNCCAGRRGDGDIEKRYAPREKSEYEDDEE